MNTYIVIQMTVESERMDGINKMVNMNNIVRKVKAKSRELAIGKFVIATQKIVANKKLEIECYDLNELKSL